MTDTSHCNSCATPKLLQKACCQPARIPALPSSWVKKASASGLVVMMKQPWAVVSITLIPKTTCATHKPLRSTCIKRPTPAPTCLRKSIYTASMAMSTNSCVSLKAVDQQTKAICIRKPRRHWPQRRWRNSWSIKCAHWAPLLARHTISHLLWAALLRKAHWKWLNWLPPVITTACQLKATSMVRRSVIWN